MNGNGKAVTRASTLSNVAIAVDSGLLLSLHRLQLLATAYMVILSRLRGGKRISHVFRSQRASSILTLNPRVPRTHRVPRKQIRPELYLVQDSLPAQQQASVLVAHLELCCYSLGYYGFYEDAKGGSKAQKTPSCPTGQMYCGRHRKTSPTRTKTY